MYMYKNLEKDSHEKVCYIAIYNYIDLPSEFIFQPPSVYEKANICTYVHFRYSLLMDAAFYRQFNV